MAAQSGDTCVLMSHCIIGPTGPIMNMVMMIVHHLVRIVSGASDDSYIRGDDIEVFVLMIHFYLEKKMTMNVSTVCSDT